MSDTSRYFLVLEFQTYTANVIYLKIQTINT